ncbi:MAG: HAD family hydrolase [Lentisphaeria bacterium]|nr:HAD family hydrolase [Lentisphaeria bacterium]
MTDCFDLFCFDFDGTIGDTEPDIRNAWLEAIAELGWKTDNFDSVFRVGPPLQVTAGLLFPDKTDAERELLQNTYKHFYDDEDNHIALPYPGVIEVIKELYRRNKRIYIVTNKRGKILNKMMRRFGLMEFCHGMFFPDIADSTNHLFKNDLLAMAMRCAGYPAEKVLMIGDTVLDIQAAKVNGCFSAAVTWGYSSEEELFSEKPDYMIDSPEKFLV